VIIIAYVLCTILVRAYVSGDGYVSPDSAQYLRLAERILSGHGLVVPSEGRAGSDTQWFAVWPAGYSTFIAVVAWALDVSTIAASKVLNSALLIIAILALYKQFNRIGLIAALVLLSAGTLENYTMTWSEAPFLTSLILLSLFLGGILNDQVKLSPINMLVFLILVSLPFCFRYIGLFVIAPVFLLSIYFFSSGRTLDAAKTWMVLVLAASLSATYLFNNMLQTGYATGIERIAALETSFELSVSLIAAVVREFILIDASWTPGQLGRDLLVGIWALFSLVLIALTRKELSQKRKLQVDPYTLSFVVIGVCYVCAIVYSRWTTHFDDFSFRILDPGFSLIFLGTAIWLANLGQRSRLAVTFVLSTAAVIVAVSNFYPILRNMDQIRSYYIHTEQNREKYSTLSDSDIVIFGEIELMYLRPNVRIALPRFSPYHSYDEPWSEFLNDLNRDALIYVETGKRSKIENRYHNSVREAVKKLQQDEIIRLTP